jgi:hypothetical protein
MLYFVMHIMFFYLFSEKSFTVYTFNNISTYYMFHNKLNFKLKGISSSSEAYIEIFLMASNPNVLLGDMYYIQLPRNSYHYNYNYQRRYTLRKCTSNHGDRVTIHGNGRLGCGSIIYKVSISVNFKLWINLIFVLLELMCPDNFITQVVHSL